jgi:uncharacterized protein (TIGR02246 family)
MSPRRFALAFLPVLLLACLLFAPAPGHAQDKPPDQLRTLSREELDVVKVLTAQEKAWNAGNLDAFASGYKVAPDTLFLGDHLSRGYETMLNDYKKNYPNRDAMGTLTFSELEPKVLDDNFAVVIGKYHLERGKKVGGPSDGLFSLVFQKTDKGWKIIVDHTT